MAIANYDPSRVEDIVITNRLILTEGVAQIHPPLSTANRRMSLKQLLGSGQDPRKSGSCFVSVPSL